MKKTLLFGAALLCGATAFAVTSTPQGFTDDLDAAMAAAKDSGKFVYVCFSGSDWCGWCIKLEQEVFSEATFAPAVKERYELVYIDSPRDQDRLSARAKEKNPALTKKFKIRGFPSYVILNPDGSELTRGSAYRAGGPQPYAAFLNEIAVDPGKIERMKKLTAEWIDPFDVRFKKLMDEVNVACEQFMDAEAAKPENKAAGKTRDDFRSECITVVRQHLPKFRKLADDAREQAKSAPAEIVPAMNEYTTRLDKWVQMIEK